jgi:hypothetical protein
LELAALADFCPGSQRTTLSKGYPLLGPVPDDEVIVKAEVEELGSVDQLPCEPKILPGRGRIAGGMVVDEYQRGGPYAEGRSENFPRVHERGRLRARRDEGVHQVVILGVQIDDPEVFLIVVSSPEEVPSE